MQVKKQQLELDIEQLTGSKLGKGYSKPVYHHPAYLTSMQSTSCKIPGWMKHKLEVRLPREISTTLHMKSKEELKSILMRTNEETRKAGLKFNIETNKQTKTSKSREKMVEE